MYLLGRSGRLAIGPECQMALLLDFLPFKHHPILINPPLRILLIITSKMWTLGLPTKRRQHRATPIRRLGSLLALEMPVPHQAHGIHLSTLDQTYPDWTSPDLLHQDHIQPPISP
jgi:hypothetical protein